MTIKFIGIYKPTGERFVPHKIDFNGKIVTGDFDGTKDNWCMFSTEGVYGDVLLKQYTGLNDLDGNEIYNKDEIIVDEKVKTVEFEYGIFGCYETYTISYVTGERVKKLQPLIDYISEGVRLV